MNVLIVDNKKYTFISKEWDINDLILNECVQSNDIFKKYNSTLNLRGECIICDDSTKLAKFEKITIAETYDEYQDFIKKYDIKRDQWIYNIIDGISEQNDIIYNDDLCCVIPNYTWNTNFIDKLHILAIVKDKNLRSIRSLDKNNVELLLHLKQQTIKIIKSKYNIDDNKLKMYLHYAPSTYHLHVHFVNISNIEAQSSVEYSHELNNVIFNLNLCSDYYKLINLNKRI